MTKEISPKNLVSKLAFTIPKDDFKHGSWIDFRLSDVDGKITIERQSSGFSLKLKILNCKYCETKDIKNSSVLRFKISKDRHFLDTNTIKRSKNLYELCDNSEAISISRLDTLLRTSYNNHDYYVSIEISHETDEVKTFQIANDLKFKKQLQYVYQHNIINGDIILKMDKIDEPQRKKIKLDSLDNENKDSKDGVKIYGYILKGVSKQFNNFLNNNSMEQKSNIIYLDAKSLKDIDDMVYFIFTNELRDNANAINLIQLAHLYGIQSLYHRCIPAIFKNINLDNFPILLELFTKYNIPVGIKKLEYYGSVNLLELKETDYYEGLPVLMKYILNR